MASLMAVIDDSIFSVEKFDSGGATPTTALTHPRMFEYFPQTQKEDYEFQHMVTASCLLLYLGHQQPNGLPQANSQTQKLSDLKLHLFL